MQQIKIQNYINYQDILNTKNYVKNSQQCIQILNNRNPIKYWNLKMKTQLGIRKDIEGPNTQQRNTQKLITILNWDFPNNNETLYSKTIKLKIFKRDQNANHSTGKIPQNIKISKNKFKHDRKSQLNIPLNTKK